MPYELNFPLLEGGSTPPLTADPNLGAIPAFAAAKRTVSLNVASRAASIGWN